MAPPCGASASNSSSSSWKNQINSHVGYVKNFLLFLTLLLKTQVKLVYVFDFCLFNVLFPFLYRLTSSFVQFLMLFHQIYIKFLESIQANLFYWNWLTLWTLSGALTTCRCYQGLCSDPWLSFSQSCSFELIFGHLDSLTSSGEWDFPSIDTWICMFFSHLRVIVLGSDWNWGFVLYFISCSAMTMLSME